MSVSLMKEASLTFVERLKKKKKQVILSVILFYYSSNGFQSCPLICFDNSRVEYGFFLYLLYQNVKANVNLAELVVSVLAF